MGANSLGLKGLATGPLAQLAEQGALNAEVAGSTPARPTKEREEKEGMKEETQIEVSFWITKLSALFLATSGIFGSISLFLWIVCGLVHVPKGFGGLSLICLAADFVLESVVVTLWNRSVHAKAQRATVAIATGKEDG